MIRYLFIVLVSISVYSVQAQQTKYEAITHDNGLRTYITYVPSSYDGSKPVPVLLNFHGYTSSALVQMGYGDFRPIADTSGFLIVHPQGLLFQGQTHWNVGGWTTGSTVDDLDFIDKLLDTLVKEYTIDTSKVYSTGMSNGGFMSFLLACQLSNRIAAIASVTGSMTTSTYSNCNPQRPVPVLQIHGTADPTVPYNGATWTKSLPDVMAYWKKHNGCTNDSTLVNLPDVNKTDNSTVSRLSYNNCSKCAITEHYKIDGGVHSWPGSFGISNKDFNASLNIWNFLSQHTLEGCATAKTESVKNEQMTVYPNPAESSVNVAVASENIQSVKLFSISGQLLFEGTESEISITNLERGLVIVRLETKSGTYVKKLMIH